MPNQIESPDGIPREDADRPSPDTSRTVGNGTPEHKATEVRANSAGQASKDPDPQAPAGEYPANDQPLPGKR